MTSQQRYKLSFTAISLMVPESIQIAEIYTQCRDWEETRKIIRGQNILQSRTNKRDIRVTREIIQRISTLTPEQLALLVNGSMDEQRLILWLAVCKCYEFIHEFAVEVIHEKFLTMVNQVTDDDYRAFFNRKASWHPELDEVTESTKKKLQTRIFDMMTKAGFFDNNTIYRVIPSSRLVEVINNDPPATYRIYPSLSVDFQG
jgi:hypothetical protein